MKNIVLSVVVVSTLVVAGIGGTFAGFVDTEISQGNFYQAGISDLLVNGKNDPIGPKLTYVHGAPCKSVDFWIDIYNWGECQGGDVFMHYKDVVSEEDGRKDHMGTLYVYDGVAPAVGDIPAGYRPAVGDEPKGPGVWSSEPEKIAEVGDGWVDQIYVPPDHPCLLGEDYASGIADHLSVTTRVAVDPTWPTYCIYDKLVDADTNGDGVIDAAEEAAATWKTIDSLTVKLAEIECEKNLLGFLPTQQAGWIHITLHLQQIECIPWDDEQTKYWPTNALQGDIATWAMMFELITDP
jgi:hypothetical protein